MVRRIGPAPERTRTATGYSRTWNNAQHLSRPTAPPLHQGRSLTYRYAALAPVWAGAVFDATVRCRRAARGGWPAAVLQHFAEPARSRNSIWVVRGVRSRSGSPTPGPGSPYWSSKGFAGLVLPADHPVWTSDGGAAARWRRGTCAARFRRRAGWCRRPGADGVVRVVTTAPTTPATERSPGRPWLLTPRVRTHTGPEYDGSLVDSHVALVDGHGRASASPTSATCACGYAHRSLPTPRAWRVGPLPRWGWPPQQPEFVAGPWLTTASALRGPVEVRLVRVDELVTEPWTSPTSPTDLLGPWTLRVSGYGAADTQPLTMVVRDATAEATRPDGLTSLVVGLRGLPLAQVWDGRGPTPSAHTPRCPCWTATSWSAQARSAARPWCSPPTPTGTPPACPP